MKKFFAVTFLFISILFKPALSQLPYETAKAALIYQFAKNTENAVNKNKEKYNIKFLGNDDKTMQELQKISAAHPINGKNVEVLKIQNLNQISETDILYADAGWSKKIEEIWVKIQGKNILLVTENCSDANFIMLNIFFNQKENKVNFEINKANLTIENFTFNEDILLLGGKEVDLRELYLEMKQKLENEKTAAEKQRFLISQQTTEIHELNKNADSLRREINKQINNIFVSELKLIGLTDSIKIQQNKLSEKLAQIQLQETKLSEQKNEIAVKEKYIEKYSRELKKIISESNANKSVILEQENILSNKENIIKTKNRQLYLSIAVILLFFILVSVILYTFNTKIKTSKKLKDKNTELEKTLEKLKEAQSQLIQSEKMASLGILTAGIAHEINNPVNYINSGLEGLKTINSEIINTVNRYINILEKNNSDKKISEKINADFEFLLNGTEKLTKNIQKGTERAAEIIRSLSIFSRNDNDKLTLNDIHENINSAVTLLHNQTKNRIEIIKNYTGIPKILCFPGKLNQVFMNIISNAVHAIENQGTITISTALLKQKENPALARDYIHISIKDTGTGIPEKYINNIFEPFFTTKEVGKGTGLGLSISYEIINQHNGKITAKNNSDKGAEFCIYLPAITN